MTTTTEEQRAEPIPCPFCGTHLVGEGDSESNFYEHPRGDCFFSEWEFDCMDIVAWNRRSPPPAAEGVEAKLPDCGHGHVHQRADGAMARCGGPELCSLCARDLAAITKAGKKEEENG